MRERVPVTVLIWQDDAYGLIKWKMALELGRDVAIGFSNPDFVGYAESFGARGIGSNRPTICCPCSPNAHRGPRRRHRLGDHLSG